MLINEERYELTQSQQAMWAGQKVSPRSPLYNMAHTFELFGAISVPEFQQAFQRLINDFDCFRIVFEEDDDGAPFQKILNELSHEMEVIADPKTSSESDNLKSFFERRATREFDLSKPLFDTCLMKIADEHFIWYLNLHHLVTDATSVTLLFKKMAKYYHAKGNNDVTLSDQLSFSEYIVHESAAKQKRQGSEVESFWNEQVSNANANLNPYGQKNSALGTEAVRLKVPVSSEQLQKLTQITSASPYKSLSKDLSSFSVLSTLFVAYLHITTGDSRITFGAPSSNRSNNKLRSIAGLIIEVLPITVEIDENDTFQSLFKKVQESIFAFLKNVYPGASNVDTGNNFSAVLNYLPLKFPDFGDISVKATWIHPGHIDKTHSLRLQVFDYHDDENFQLFLDVNTNVFSNQTANRIPNHFVQVINNFLKDDQAVISSQNLLDDVEIRDIEKSLNWPLLEDNKYETFLDQFESVVLEYGTSIAVSHESKELTYLTFNDRINQLVNFLTGTFKFNKARIVVHLKRSDNLLVSILAILKVGGTYVPIPSDYPAGRIRNIIDDVDPALIITQDELLSNVESAGSTILNLNQHEFEISACTTEFSNVDLVSSDPAYIMYTSGSTGEPKGVVISHSSLYNYLNAAKGKYADNSAAPTVPLFTSIGFDLTVTSLFLPLMTGGTIKVFQEENSGHDLSILKVIEDRNIDFIKMTPSHARLIADMDLSQNRMKTVILGGENLDSELAAKLYASFATGVRIFNEYGPTEATVGCIAEEYSPDTHQGDDVPIGKPFANTQAYVLDKRMNRVPVGVSGELWLGGPGLSSGYWNRAQITKMLFREIPFSEGAIYKTGDLVRLDESGNLDYLGRVDRQLKIGGIRIEAGEMETLLAKYPGIEQVVVSTEDVEKDQFILPEKYCATCGIPSNYPGVVFDENDVCDLCNGFETYQQNVSHYFKETEELRSILYQARSTKSGKYDCLMLLSGGKDSSYALAQLVKMNLNVLAFTLDNGFISDGAKENVKRTVESLGVDHVYGTTSAMNEIFVDSLKRHSNVCNGCFKTLYTLATQKALELGIPAVITGLSRGQFFETRLSEELFRKKKIDTEDIDKTILDARKAYHQTPDAVSKLLDVSMFENDEVFEKVKFVDFYRYCDVSLSGMLEYLDQSLNWVRPEDTGRSTNCLINDLGIFMHKKQRGYHNYAFPYSWDVRIGHKEREETLDELNDDIEVEGVNKMLKKIGYPTNRGNESTQLIVYYSGIKIPSDSLRTYLADYLPQSIIPAKFVHIEAMPLTSNGKIDFYELKKLGGREVEFKKEYVAPSSDLEIIIAEIWQEVMQMNEISIDDKFLELGGNSLMAIRIISRINETVHLDLSVLSLFETNTIRGLSMLIENTILANMEEQ